MKEHSGDANRCRSMSVISSASTWRISVTVTSNKKNLSKTEHNVNPEHVNILFFFWIVQKLTKDNWLWSRVETWACRTTKWNRTKPKEGKDKTITTSSPERAVKCSTVLVALLPEKPPPGLMVRTAPSEEERKCARRNSVYKYKDCQQAIKGQRRNNQSFTRSHIRADIIHTRPSKSFDTFLCNFSFFF